MIQASILMYFIPASLSSTWIRKPLESLMLLSENTKIKAGTDYTVYSMES